MAGLLILPITLFFKKLERECIREYISHGRKPEYNNCLVGKGAGEKNSRGFSPLGLDQALIPLNQKQSGELKNIAPPFAIDIDKMAVQEELSKCFIQTPSPSIHLATTHYKRKHFESMGEKFPDKNANLEKATRGYKCSSKLGWLWSHVQKSFFKNMLTHKCPTQKGHSGSC